MTTFYSIAQNSLPLNLSDVLEKAVQQGNLLHSSVINIKNLWKGSTRTVTHDSIIQLIEAKAWEELNDRFYKTLAFGTGGLRGRTIGRLVTDAESGEKGPHNRPQYPCVGTACMNEYNVGRAMRGLVAFLKKDFEQRHITRRPKCVIGHDTRHFSRDFAQYCGKIATELGCDVYLFEGPRATPQVSFAIRQLGADTGVVLTASHNPSHDNGLKAYYNQGAQLIEPQASRVISEVNSLEDEHYEPLPESEQGRLILLGEEADRLYMDDVKNLVLAPELFERDKGEKTRVIFTNLHGTGGHCIVPLLREVGLEVHTVAQQDMQDGRFPTVDSPNPENGPALAMGVELAKKKGGSIVIGTDPDCDRMGVAVADREGEMHLLTGNQIGSLLAWYRTKTFFEKGILTQSNRSHALLIKTFVTTELQTAIADAYGIGMVNTLTGFKYIAAKLQKYEDSIPEEKKGTYRELSSEQRRALSLEYSRFFIFGGEESYGYLATDSLRDKDANGAALMFAELAAYATSEGKTILELLDALYERFGYHLEVGKSLVMEGADGAASIAKLAESYIANPPEELDGVEVREVLDFSKGDLEDVEGDSLPAEMMLIFELADGRRCAVRPSGTEPKIKYYLFGKDMPHAADLELSKQGVSVSLEALWCAVERDAKQRLS